MRGITEADVALGALLPVAAPEWRFELLRSLRRNFALRFWNHTWKKIVSCFRGNNWIIKITAANESYLNPCLAESHLVGQLLAHKRIGVMSAAQRERDRGDKINGGPLYVMKRWKLKPYRSNIFSSAANCPLENVVRLRRGFFASAASADDRI